MRCAHRVILEMLRVVVLKRCWTIICLAVALRLKTERLVENTEPLEFLFHTMRHWRPSVTKSMLLSERNQVQCA